VDILTQYAWIAWLVLILLFAVIELFTLELTFLMLALGGAFGLISGLFGLPWWAQFISAAVVAMALILLLRPPLLWRLHSGGDPTPSNIDAIVGSDGRVVVPLTTTAGQVRLSNGELWSARLAALSDLGEVGVGTPVLVTAVIGATISVVPLERTGA